VRIRLDVSYDGTDFNGWATQPGLRTVQGTFEDALATALRLPRVRVVCAGRTDAGVHARGQVLHTDMPPDALDALVGRSRDAPLAAFVRRVNGILPPDVRVRSATEAEPGFDARFSAIWRRYTYRVADRPDGVDPLLRHLVLAWPHVLDVDALNLASTPLLGLQDFASFCRRREGATTVRTLLELAWSRTPNGLVEARVVADAFCHTMVRSLVGCLLEVGEGRQPPEWPAEMLAGRTRVSSLRVVRPHGLTLEEVRYPEGDELLAQAERARNARSPIP
jgi:tRNA pseudouridine38-40 synthase